ncbi:hypothetical protein N8864_04325 [Gammaproteobacteria bacterium]|nr:hypothetical protein [Gammaproteobacteria bacterium]
MTNTATTKTNVFNSMMEFTATKFDGFYKATNSVLSCYLEEVATIGWVASYEDPKDLTNCDEESFDTPKQAIAWLETKVPFAMKLAEFK